MRRGDGALTPEGAFDLGLRYDRGEGMPQDSREAARLYHIAADQGHAWAQYNIAQFYRYGKGVIQNHHTAASYYRLSADQGCAVAQCDIAACYKRGEGVLQSHSEAARWYHLAADQGDAQALNNLANCYARGQGVIQNDSEAARHVRLAADQGLAHAQSNYAQYCSHGQGVPQDYGECARYHRLAADQGFAPSQLALGAMLIDDEHFPAAARALEPADPRAGARLLARAAQSVGADNEPQRLQALGLLRHYAAKREVVAACCIGCGAIEGLKQCTRCHVARFCGSACMKQMWKTHKQSCKEWQDEQGDVRSCDDEVGSSALSNGVRERGARRSCMRDPPRVDGVVV
jgi:TPR repeat protein